MHTRAISYDYPSFTVENDHLYSSKRNVFNCLNLPYHQQLQAHCFKCGRRSRNHNPYRNNRRVKSEQRPFPTELPPYPVVTPTNDNHSVSTSIFSRNSSRKSKKQNVIIDQLIQVQQLNSMNRKTRSHRHNYDSNHASNKDEHRSFTDTMNFDGLKQVQQIIYLRENINNLSYREIHFPHEYIILKRLEEKNNLINPNRFKVDQYFRSLKLQYRTISTLFQSIPITSFTYAKQDPYHFDLTTETSCLPSDNQITSLPTTVEMDETITNEISIKYNDHSMPTDSPISITPYNEYKHQQYSQNANPSYMNIDHLTKTTKQNMKFDTAVIIDVKKCPEVTRYQPQIHTISNQSIYFDQYSRFQQPQIMVFPYSQNANYISRDSNFHQLIYHESLPNIAQKTTCFPPNVEQQYSTTNQQSSPSSSDPTTTDISSSLHQKFSTNSDTTSNISTTNLNDPKNNQSRKYSETLHKIRQILHTLQRNLLSKSLPSNQIDQSISNTMTSDSLVRTYSVSSTLPILNKNNSRLSSSNVGNEILQMDLDSLNNNYYSERTKSTIKLLNSAKNINTNQQRSDDEETENSLHSRSRRSRTGRITVQYMSPSFVFVLQILLVMCLVNRILMFYFFGIVPSDTLVSIIVDHSQSVAPISSGFIRATEQTAGTGHGEIVPNFLSSFLNLFNSEKIFCIF